MNQNILFANIKISVVCVVVSTLAFGSCTRSINDTNDNNVIYAPIDKIVETDLPLVSDCFSHEDTIFLDSSNDECALGYIDDIKQMDNTIFIQSDNSIYLFESDGSFVRKINRKGRGHGEYLTITHFDVSDGYIHILDIDLKKVIVYDYMGKLIRQLQFDDIVFDFAVMDNGDYVFYNPEYFDESLKRGLWQTDSTYQNYKQLVTIQEQYRHTVINKHFLVHIDEQKIGFMSAEDSDCIYTITNDTIYCTAKITTDIEMSKKIKNSRTVSLKHRGKEYVKSSYLETNNFLLFAVSNMYDSEVNVIVDKNRKKVYRIYPSDVNRITQIDELFPSVSYSYDGVLYSVIYAQNIVAVPNYEQTPFARVTADSNPVLICYE